MERLGRLSRLEGNRQVDVDGYPWAITDDSPKTVSSGSLLTGLAGLGWALDSGGVVLRATLFAGQKV